MKVLIPATVLSLTIAGLAAAPAAADTTLAYSVDGKHDAYLMRIRAGEVRIDAGGEWQLYRHSENALYIVDPDEQSYLRIGPEDREAIQAELAEARDAMERELEHLAEEYPHLREELGLSSGPGPAEGESRFALVAEGRTGEAAAVSCAYFTVSIDGEDLQQLCVTNFTKLDISKAESEALKAMYAFLNETFADVDFEQMSLPYLRLDGIPVMSDRGAGSGAQRLESFTAEPIADSVFELPAGFLRERPVAPDQ